VHQFTSPSHLTALIVSAATIGVLVPLARFRPGSWVTVASWLLAVFLVGNEIVYQLVQVGNGTWNVSHSLPLYLCDIGAFVGAVALIWPRPILVEVTWFWAIAGTLQGILTPDHVILFPSYDWLEFYGDHIGVVLAAVFLVIGRRVYPQPGAVLRVIVVSVVVLVMVGVVDARTGANYDFLRFPSPGSIQSLLGPWPWYILGTTAVGLVLFGLLDLPFWPQRRRAKRLDAPRSGLGNIGSNQLV
jgi:hypothetical integral membrane protein (TIGR02206 family)